MLYQKEVTFGIPYGDYFCKPPQEVYQMTS